MNLKGNSADCSIHTKTRNVVILTVLNKSQNDTVINDISYIFQNIEVVLTYCFHGFYAFNCTTRLPIDMYFVCKG